MGRTEAGFAEIAARLGADAFAAAQRRGASMSDDEIITYALDHLARIAEPSRPGTEPCADSTGQ